MSPALLFGSTNLREAGISRALVLSWWCSWEEAALQGSFFSSSKAAISFGLLKHIKLSTHLHIPDWCSAVAPMSEGSVQSPASMLLSGSLQ